MDIIISYDLECRGVFAAAAGKSAYNDGQDDASENGDEDGIDEAAGGGSALRGAAQGRSGATSICARSSAKEG